MIKKNKISVYMIIIYAIFIAIFIRTFLFDAIIINGNSMLPTIKSGSIGFVLKCAYGIRKPFSNGYLYIWRDPKPNEIVLLKFSGTENKKAIKRVFETGPAYIYYNANKIYGRAGVRLAPESSCLLYRGTTFINQGRIFVSGDNENESLDSRQYGTVPIENICGKVLFWSK